MSITKTRTPARNRYYYQNTEPFVVVVVLAAFNGVLVGSGSLRMADIGFSRNTNEPSKRSTSAKVHFPLLSCTPILNRERSVMKP